MATATAKKAVKQTVTSSHPLAHLIPDDLYREEYVSRVIHGVRDVDLCRYAKAARNNLMLFGPTGPGKTSLVLAYAATDQIPLVTVQCNGGIDPASFWGQPEMDADGKIRWIDSEITKVVEHGGVLYLDEVNYTPPKVMAAFQALLDKRRQVTILEKGNQVIKAHDDLQIICAFNPDYEGTKPLNASFKNRYSLKIRFDYDEAVERELVCLPVMLQLAAKLRMAQRNGDLETPVSTNMLIEFEEIAVDLSYGFAVENFLNAFSEEERQSVTEAFDLFSEQIKSELAQMEAMA